MTREDLEQRIREELEEALGFNYPSGTMVYHLTRCKSAFGVGTVTIDDFVEVQGELVDDLLAGVMKVYDNLK